MTLCKIASLVAFAGLAAIAVVAEAKCPTEQIEVRGADIKDTILIDDPAVLTRFNIWNGPTVRVNGKTAKENQPGAFVDWMEGIVKTPPAYTATFKVSFFCRADAETTLRKMYEVDYVFVSSMDGGYFYLPGSGDEDRFRLNTSSILHRVEGNWFRSTAAWEQYLRPVILETQAR